MSLTRFKSKRNIVYFDHDSKRVIKILNDHSLYLKEIYLLEQLSIKNLAPSLIDFSDHQIIMSYIEGKTLLEVLEESQSFEKEPWQLLGDYLEECFQITHELPKDVNLRNFIYSKFVHKVYGIDFEQYDCYLLDDCMNQICAFILSYNLKNEVIQKEIVDYFKVRYQLDSNLIQEQLNQITKSRKRKPD